jgi:hypothetical protein
MSLDGNETVTINYLEETMKTRITVKVLAVVAVLMFAGFSRADSVTLVSSDKADTYAYGHVEKANFIWVMEETALYADITFSNWLYAGDGGESASQEYFLFKFPGVTFDSATKTFYARNEDGRPVPVAVMEDAWTGQRIKPLPGTCVYISNSGGTVQLVLKGTTNPEVKYASHWVPCGDIIGKESLAAR